MSNPIPGIRRRPTGTWQVYCRVYGQFHQRTYPADTSPSKLQEHLERLRVEARYGVQVFDDAQGERTFRQDAAKYLGLVESMPTIRDRRQRIMRWVDAFGARPRSSLTPREIRAQLEQWRLAGYRGHPLKPATLNQYRTALMHLYSTLDGQTAPNTVKDVPAYDERYSEAVRAESMLTCARLIRRLRPRGTMRAVLHALLWTGWPHALLAEVTAKDIDATRGRVRVTRRIKGKGMRPAWIPVVPRAILALRQLIERKATGRHSTSSLHKALRRAVVSENKWREARNAEAGEDIWPLVDARFSPYGLRHSFATWAAGKIRDDRALKELLRTNSIRRYTEGALADRLEWARDALAPPKRPAKVVSIRRA
jgi:integrase